MLRGALQEARADPLEEVVALAFDAIGGRAAKQVAKEYRQVLLIVAAGVSAALAATAVVFFFLGRKK